MPFEEPEYATASFWEFFEKFQESSRSTTTPVPSPTPGMSVDDVMDDDEIIYPITDGKSAFVRESSYGLFMGGIDEVAFNFYPNLDYPSSEIEVDDEEETEDDEETFGTYPGYPPFANYPGYTSSVAEPESTDEATSTSEDATPSFPTDVAAAEDAADPAPLPTPEANQGVRFARF
ncbi:hypothetical protein K474DRAFT_1664390 [Panus rudis PR-1116 ss-1]|nr:hypothetical protein K474DRAFT_1664390 [Panus rudis PR-1116 ss-1]